MEAEQVGSATLVEKSERAAWGPPGGDIAMPAAGGALVAPLPGGIPSKATADTAGLAETETEKLVPGGTAGAKTEKAGRARRSSTTAVSIFEAMDAHANKHKCGPLYNLWVYAFLPTGPFRTVWDTIILVLVITSCFKDPYQTAFHLEKDLWRDPGNTGMTTADWILDLIFYADMVLNFWTGYDTGYMVVTNKGMIARHYLTSRFPIDVLATVEWDLLIRWIRCGSSLECTGALRDLNDTTAIAKMLKVLRLARAGPLISRLTAHMTAHSAYINALKFFLYVVVVAHVLACLFYMVPILFECEELDVSPVGDGPALFNTNHTCMATSWRVNYGLNDVNNDVNEHGKMEDDGAMTPRSRYLNALYWSLTTMTTIGYGDRGPGNDPEIQFTMFSELVGLFFFVLLLDQITTVYNEVRRELSNKNAIKDEIVQYMKSAIPSGDAENAEKAKTQLIDKVVTFLNFKGNSQSSHQFDPSGAFSHLSGALQEEINIAVFLPMLAEIRMFGHCNDDKKDAKNVQRLFAEADPDGSGQLDESEIRNLIENLGVKLSDEDLQEAMDAMDSSRAKAGSKAAADAAAQAAENSTAVATQGTAAAQKEDVHVELEEFEQWWFQQKHKRPKVPPCPDAMLMWFALRIQSECSSPGDRIVRMGEYGDRFYVVMQGQVEICDHAEAAPEPDSTWTRDAVTPRLLKTIVPGKDSDPLFGLLGLLDDAETAAEYSAIQHRTRKVAVYAGRHAHDYTECLFFPYGDLVEGLSRDYHGHCWELTEFDSALAFWKECARNFYHKLYAADEREYFWGKYQDGYEEEDTAEDPFPQSAAIAGGPQPPPAQVAGGGAQFRRHAGGPGGASEVQQVEQRLAALEANMDQRLGRMEAMLGQLVADR
jgi:Ca2+-binding EF-hand superfamily protein